MADVVTIGGSPSSPSRSSAVLSHIRGLLHSYMLSTAAVHVRDLSPIALFSGRVSDRSIEDAISQVSEARAVIIATPIYKAAYTGALKAFLDLLPSHALRGKIIFPIATGGSPAHLLAIDYALKPVLSALGGEHILSGLYIQDTQIQYEHDTLTWLDAAIAQRLHTGVQALVDAVCVISYLHAEALPGLGK